MQHMGGGGDSSPSDAIVADYNADGASAEDEYNPDVSEISQFDMSRPFHIMFSASTSYVLLLPILPFDCGASRICLVSI